MNTDACFRYEPSPYVPFRNVEALELCRRIPREAMERHANPNYRIRVVKDADLEFIWVTDMFHRIFEAREAGRKLVLIMPNPCPVYRHVARLINRFRVPVDHVTLFAMDEYADQDGRIAPEEWPQGFVHALKKYLYREIAPELRMPEAQVIGPTDANVSGYSRMIEDAGGADQVYTGPGWTGHIAFVEPDAPEFDLPLDEWMRRGRGDCHTQPVYAGAELAARQLRHERRHRRGAAEGVHDWAGGRGAGEEPHGRARHHGSRDPYIMAAPDDAAVPARAGHPAPAHLRCTSCCGQMCM